MEAKEFYMWFNERCRDALFNVSEVSMFLEDERKDILNKIENCEEKTEERLLRIKINKVVNRKDSLKDVINVLEDMATIADEGFLANKDIVINTAIFRRKKESQRYDREQREKMAALEKKQRYMRFF